jgi:hypothetical protein
MCGVIGAAGSVVSRLVARRLHAALTFANICKYPRVQVTEDAAVLDDEAAMTFKKRICCSFRTNRKAVAAKAVIASAIKPTFSATTMGVVSPTKITIVGMTARHKFARAQTANTAFVSRNRIGVLSYCKFISANACVTTSTLCITCQHKYGPNNSVSRAGNKLRHDTQVGPKLRPKYWQDEKDPYEERQSVWLQAGQWHCQSIWK